MATLLYLHGFLSSPASHKAIQVKQWLAQYRPDIHYACPHLSPYPKETQQTLLAQLAKIEGSIGLIGSSLGGFWATWLAEEFDMRAVVVNPSVNPMAMFPQYLNRSVKSYHSEETYFLRDQHLTELWDLDTPVVKRSDNYWLLAQKGDEVLDYRLAEKKYALCKQNIEQGGDHAFQNFERYIEPIVEFLFPN